MTFMLFSIFLLGTCLLQSCNFYENYYGCFLRKLINVLPEYYDFRIKIQKIWQLSMQSVKHVI